uniref:Uncharacterized protein n=1 Tax=Caenorhabditis japonica TaxID=281687 RepID=A0A8R1ER12_CAEJA
MKPSAMPSASPIVVGFAPKSFPLPSPPLPPTAALPVKNKFPTYHADLNEECQRKKTTEQKRDRRRRRRDTKLLSSSSECLKYYPVDMPGEQHVEEEMKRPNRRRARMASPLRSSTPNGSDSAYSILPTTH